MSRVISLKIAILDFMLYVESKNSHGRNELKKKLTELDLKNTHTYKWVESECPASIGKNVLKNHILTIMIEQIPVNTYITVKG